jgi:hypothetical protein
LLAQPPSRALCCSGLSSLHAPRTAHTHLTHHTNCTLTTHSPHTSYTPHTHLPHHSTPYTHSTHTLTACTSTPLILHAVHRTRTTLTTHLPYMTQPLPPLALCTHTTSTPHHIYSPHTIIPTIPTTTLVLAHASWRWHSVLAVPRRCTMCLISSLPKLSKAVTSLSS